MAEVKITVEVDGVRFGGRFDTKISDTYEIGNMVEETLDKLINDEGFRPLRDGEEF